MNAEFWNERYGHEAYAYGTEPNDFLKAEAHRIPARGQILCLAEGEGRNAAFLAEMGHRVTAVDQSSEGLRKAQALAAAKGVSVATVCADLASFELGAAAYDAVVAIFAHLPAALRARVHAAAVRALKPGGVFILEAYRMEQLALNSGGPRDATMLMSVQGLERELAPLSFDVARNAERDIQEGAFHKGLSATVQIVARRT